MLNNKTELNITLPAPINCDCKDGMLVPILRPVIGMRTDAHGIKKEVWGNMYQVFWQCTSCDKRVE